MLYPIYQRSFKHKSILNNQPDAAELLEKHLLCDFCKSNHNQTHTPGLWKHVI